MEYRKISKKENSEEKEPGTQRRKCERKTRRINSETKLEKIKIFVNFL